MMRSHLGILVCAILLTGASSETAEITALSRPIQTTINPGDDIFVLEVPTFNDLVTKCQLTTVQGYIIEFKPNDGSHDRFQKLDNTDISGCRARVDVQYGDGGLWTLTSTSDEDRVRVQQYNVTVNLADTDYYTLGERNFTIQASNIGERFFESIPDPNFGEHDGCRVIKPNGETLDVEQLNYYYAHDDNDDIDGDDGGIFNGFNATEVIWRGQETYCAVVVKVASPSVIGRWLLIASGTQYSRRIERRLPFTIRVEDLVNTTEVADISVREGNNFYVRLKRFIKVPDVSSCKLLAPNGSLPENVVDLKLANNCGYLIQNATEEDNGEWEIHYELGDKIVYRTISRVTVHGAPPGDDKKVLYWIQGRPVNTTFGPDNTIYCRIISPENYVLFDGFGRCVLRLDRVIKSRHEGTWTISYGLPGQVLTEDISVMVFVREAIRQAVSTSVVMDPEGKTATLSCVLTTTIMDPVRSCKFRDPIDRILIAAEAVAEDRYSWHGTGSNYSAGVHQHDCGIRITNLSRHDIGIWRCAIETEGDNYYGFLTVPVPAPGDRDPEIVAELVRKPTLTASRTVVSAVAGDSVTMSCAIDASIRYCYFRARNGTIFNVSPADPHDFATYVGAGLDAGECGVRFPALATSDSGVWSCHVGLLEPSGEEQRARFDVDIKDPMVVSSYMNREADELTIQAVVLEKKRPLEYCRFVRIDGLGFLEESLPSPKFPNIENLSDLSRGVCTITIHYPSSLDQHPWVVVAKIRGHDAEITRVTDIVLTLPNPTPPGGGGGGSMQFRIPGAWIIVMTIGMCMILLASFIGPKKNREWTYSRASALRNSFLSKRAQQDAGDASKNTAVAA